jgi:hypothetical protein
MVGLKSFGPEFNLKLKLFESEAAKIHESAPVAIIFCSNYININKAKFGADFISDHFKEFEAPTITIVSTLFPLIYLELLTQKFKYSKINVITKQYTAIKMHDTFKKYYYNSVFHFKDAMFDPSVLDVFEQSDIVFIPDTDYMMPFEFIDHFKFKKCLSLNFKDPHERKTNNNLVFSGNELEEICDFKNHIKSGVHMCPPHGVDFFTNNRLLYAYGERL